MIRIVALSLFFNIFLVFHVSAQQNVSCRDFTQTVIKIINDNDYIPDGRFNTVKLTQGDKIQVYKPFYKGKKYIIIVASEDTLGGVNVQLTDMTRKVFYKSDKAKNLHKIEFTPEKNQNLIISVDVDKKEGEPSVRACVAVVVGFKM